MLLIQERPLESWLHDKHYIDNHWGRLESVKILDVERPTPTMHYLHAEAEMHYAYGTAIGSFSVDMKNGKPTLWE